MEVFSLPPLPSQWFVTLMCAPRGRWVRRAIPVVPVPSRFVDCVPCFAVRGTAVGRTEQRWTWQPEAAAACSHLSSSREGIRQLFPPALCWGGCWWKAGSSPGAWSMPSWVRSGCKAAAARRRHHMQLMSPLDEGTAVQRGGLHLRKLLPFCRGGS